MQSGHTGVFQRVPDEPYKEQAFIEKRLSKKLDITRIRKKIGPAVPGIAHTVYEDEKEEFDSMFEKHIQKQIQLQLKKYGGKT